MSKLFLNLFLSLIAGLISGFTVYRFIESRENKKWQLAKKQLVKFLSETANSILTSVRISIGVKPPAGITNDDDFISFINKEVVEKFDKHKTKIEYLDSEKQAALLSNFRNAQDSLRQLGTLFVAFRTAHPWYAEKVFELQRRIYDVSIPYLTFPEIGIPKYKNDVKLQGWRKLASDNVYKLCEFIVEMKNNSLVKDLLNNK